MMDSISSQLPAFTILPLHVKSVYIPERAVMFSAWQSISRDGMCDHSGITVKWELNAKLHGDMPSA